jgi:hypothetical protein
MNIKELVEHARVKMANKKLIKEYPFLLPRNRWTGEVCKDYDYSYTELDAMPAGWRKAFGLQMCKEIKEELVKFNYLNDYRILDIKEKYGSLRWYDNGFPADSKIPEIIYKYEMLSEITCINCGKEAKYQTTGWINFICEDCKNKRVAEGAYESNFIKLSEVNEDERD